MEVKLARSVANAMAEDIRKARARILRKATDEENYDLMVLMADLEHMAMGAWLTSLANRFERGQHHLAKHLEIGEDEAQEIANEQAGDLRHLKSLGEDIERQPVTEERLQQAEAVFAKYGVKLKLVDSRSRSQGQFAELAPHATPIRKSQVRARCQRWEGPEKKPTRIVA